MLLPALGSWQRDFNYNPGLSGVLKTDINNLFIGTWNSLRGVATGGQGGNITSNPMTVKGSCDGVTANMTGTNLLTAPSKFVHASSGARSWGVLRCPVTGFEVLFHFNSTTVDQVTMLWSPTGGFTGGSTTAAPTATDQQTLETNQWWAGSVGSTGGQYYGHAMRTPDGKHTRLFFCTNGVVAGMWSFEEAISTSSGWSDASQNRNIATAVNIGPSNGITTLLNANQWIGASKYFAKGPSGAMPFVITAEGRGGGSNSVAQEAWTIDELTQTVLGLVEYPIIPCGLLHVATVGQRGRLGYVPYLYFTSAPPLTGDTFPVGGSKDFTILGDMVVPSAGISMLLG